MSQSDVFIRRAIRAAIFGAGLVVTNLQAQEAPSPTRPLAEPEARSLERELPIHFEANLGQASSAVRYLTRGSRFTFSLTDHEAIWRWRRRDGVIENEDGDGLRLTFVGGRDEVRPVAHEPLPGKSHFLVGNRREQWVTHVPHYRHVSYRDVYPGIDVVYHTRRALLELDVVVAPGADPDIVTIDVDGARGIRALDNGDLELDTASGSVVLGAPVTYQDIDGRRFSIESSFERRSRDRIGFRIADYDPEHPLVIDPVITFSSYLGGSGSEEADDKNGVVVDDDGNVYIGARTASTDYPSVNAAQPTSGGGHDAMVTKIDPATQTIVYSTYLGGSGDEGVRSIAVDGAGSIYVVGETSSLDFPTQHPVQSVFAGDVDAFAAKLDPSGSSLVYSTFLGGTGIDIALGVAIDDQTGPYIVGTTASADFPTVDAVQPVFGGFADAFVVKMSPAGSDIVSSTFWGGSDRELAIEVATDDDGDVYVTGLTESADFPTVNALQPTYGGGATFFGDAFVAKLTDDGTLVAFATYLGGSDDDLGQAIAVDDIGNIYVAGATSSADFPLVDPMQGQLAGSLDVFAAKLDPSGTTLHYSTFVGGNGPDLTHGIAVDADGNVYVTGQTASTDFPVVDAVQPSYGGGTEDAIVFKLNAVGSQLIYSTYFGGVAEDKGLDIALGPDGDVFFGGHTASPDLETENPIQPTLDGPFDAYVTRISEPRPLIELALEDLGGRARLTVRVANPDTVAREVEIKIWIQSVLFPEPISFVGTPSPVATLPPQLPKVALPPFDLQTFFSFPGTIVRASLSDPVTGAIFSESTCKTLPCP